MAEVITRSQRTEPHPDKVAAVEDIKRRLESSSAVLLTEYRGMTVDELQTLRRSLRAAGAEYRVVKCTLAQRAATDAGLAELLPLLTGPIAFVFVADDAAASAKALVEAAKDVDALVVKGGVLEGRLIEESDTKALAKLPSREVLLSQIAGAFKAPMQKTANLLSAPVQNMVNLVDALKKKLEESGDDSGAAESDAEASGDAEDKASESETGDEATVAVSDDAGDGAEEAPESDSSDEPEPESSQAEASANSSEASDERSESDDEDNESGAEGDE